MTAIPSEFEHGTGTHRWFGEARSKRGAHEEAARLARELIALDDYSAALVRPREPSLFRRV